MGLRTAATASGSMKRRMTTKVSDLSPGTVLVAGTTGWRYTVTDIEGEKVYAKGPMGAIPPVTKDELQREIASGKIEVVS